MLHMPVLVYAKGDAPLIEVCTQFKDSELNLHSCPVFSITVVGDSPVIMYFIVTAIMLYCGTVAQ